MITGPRVQFVARCQQRGYSWEEVAACVVADDGKTVTVDETHPAYPRMARPGYAMVHHNGVVRYGNSIEELRNTQNRGSVPTSGPGTELKKLLARIGIKATPNCSCNAKARRMDLEESQRPGWCEEHVDEIVGWLREEAGKRKLPFLDALGRVLVRRAIRNARKEESRAKAAKEGSEQGGSAF